jgi:hypothetical protein
LTDVRALIVAVAAARGRVAQIEGDTPSYHRRVRLSGVLTVPGVEHQVVEDAGRVLEAPARGPSVGEQPDRVVGEPDRGQGVLDQAPVHQQQLRV